MLALDTDGDGELSAKEIENATASLKTLDKDKNGKLTENELRPNFDRGEAPGMGGEAIITQLMAFDKNGDGKLSKAEVPQRLQGLLERADTNKDDVLDREELLKLAISGMRGQVLRKMLDVNNRPKASVAAHLLTMIKVPRSSLTPQVRHRGLAS